MKIEWRHAMIRSLCLSCCVVGFGNAIAAKQSISTLQSNGSPSTRIKLKHLRAALDRSSPSRRPIRIVTIGNSKTAGNTGKRREAWPDVLAEQLKLAGIQAVTDSWWGNANSGGGQNLRGTTLAKYQSYDPRLSWTPNTAWQAVSDQVGGPGGALFRSTAAGATLSFRTERDVDLCEIWLATGPNGGSASASFERGGATRVDTRSAKSGVRKIVLRAKTFAKQIGIRATTSAPVTVIGAACRQSTSLQVEIYNWGWGASTSGNHTDASKPWTPVNMLRAIAPDVTIIALDTNDYTPTYGPISLPEYRANLRLLADTARWSGDCIIMSEPPSSSSRQSYIVQDQYHVVEREVAAEKQCEFIDVATEWGGTYEVMAAKGWYLDTTHGTADAYRHEGEFVSKAVLAALGRR